MRYGRQIRAAVVSFAAALLILLPAVGAQAATVQVVKGNTLSGIVWAQCHSTNWQSVWRDNPQIVNPNLIYPGQHIVVNCSSPRTPTTTAPTAIPTSGDWVHPIRAGLRASSCWGAPRNGHSHAGVDLTIGSGTPIHAVHAGIIAVNHANTGNAGFYIVVDHGGGTYTLYMHLIRRSSLGVGQHVVAGQVIGNVGATGDATGPHLHFEVHTHGLWTSGAAINPAPFMRARGVPIGC